MRPDIWERTILQLSDGASLRAGDAVVALLFAVVGIASARLLARRVGVRLRARGVDASAASMIQRITLYVLSAGALLTALQLLGVPLTMFAFLGGAIAIGVGFGAQNIIGNFISGWIIMTERQLRIGDMIEVEGHFGRVESIGARSTRVRRNDGIDIVVPNSAMLEGTVLNWTLHQQPVRTSVRVGVAYGSPTDTVRSLLRDAATEHQQILAEPEPVVVFEDFGDDALLFDVWFWCQIATKMELRVIRGDLRCRIEAALRDSGITIAFPQRDVHLDTAGPLHVTVVSSDGEPKAGE